MFIKKMATYTGILEVTDNKNASSSKNFTIEVLKQTPALDYAKEKELPASYQEKITKFDDNEVLDNGEKTFIDYSAKLLKENILVDKEYLSDKEKRTILEDLFKELDKNPEEAKKWTSAQPKLEDYLYEENGTKRLDIRLLDPIIKTQDYKMYRNKLELRTDKVSPDWIEQFNTDWNARLMIKNYFDNGTIELDKPILLPVSIKQVSNDSITVDLFASEGYVKKYGNEFNFYTRGAQYGGKDYDFDYVKKTVKTNFNRTKNAYLAELKIPIMNSFERDTYDLGMLCGEFSPYRFDWGLHILLTDTKFADGDLFPNKTISNRISYNSSEHVVSDFKLATFDCSNVVTKNSYNLGMTKTITTTTPKRVFTVSYYNPWPVPTEENVKNCKPPEACITSDTWYVWADRQGNYTITDWLKYKP